MSFAGWITAANRFISRVSFAACLLALSPVGVAAQQAAPSAQPNPAADRSLLLAFQASCFQNCFNAANLCRASPDKGLIGACDTLAVACLSSCVNCAAAYAACKPDSAVSGSVPRCLAQVLACGFGEGRAAESRSDRIVFSGGDGATMENAVVISGARSDAEGSLSEIVWLGWRRPGSRILSQSLQGNGTKTYDRLELKTADNSQVAAYFDISASFGKH